MSSFLPMNRARLLLAADVLERDAREQFATWLERGETYRFGDALAFALKLRAAAALPTVAARRAFLS